jgi:hypothetical protein
LNCSIVSAEFARLFISFGRISSARQRY